MFKIQVVGSDLFWTLVIFTTSKSRSHHGYLSQLQGMGRLEALSLAHPFAGRPGCFEVGLRLEVQGHHDYTTHNRFGTNEKLAQAWKNNSFLKIIETKAQPMS